MKQSAEDEQGSNVAAAGARGAAFFVVLTGICLLAIAIRMPGLWWLHAVTPYSGFDFHPDVMRFVRPTADFAHIPGWRGYPVGWTVQLYIPRRLLWALGLQPDPVLLIRGISLAYGVLMVFLTGVLARALTASSAVGLLAAAFLALAPMHVINSHFGTADGAMVFFVYTSFLFGWRSLERRSHLDFVLFVASVGTALAIKFFIPLLVPLALVIWHSQRRIGSAFEGFLLLAGSFSLASFFNYTPWELSELFVMIREENVSVAGGLTPPEQVAHYIWDTPVALGLAVWVLFVIGVTFLLHDAWRARSRLPRSPSAWYRATGSPLIVPVSALVVHLMSLIVAQYHAPRHLLPFLPVMCFVAALGLVRVTSRTKLPNFALGAVLAVVLPYQLYNALGTEARFTHDIRNDLAARVATVVSPAEEVTTFEDYSQIRGATIVPGRDDPSTEIESEFFLACGSRVPNDATGEFHVFQVSQRPAFYRDLFAGRLGYRLIFEVSRDDFTLEQRLATRGLLPPLGTLTPERCVIFAREDVEV